MAILIQSRHFRIFLVLLVASTVTTLLFFNIFYSDSNHLRVGYLFVGQPEAKSRCKIPQLLIDDPVIKPFLKTYGPLKCSDDKNWVYSVGDGHFYIRESAVSRHGKIECNYSRIDRINDWKYKEIDLGKLVNGTAFDGDTFRVICRSFDKDSNYDLLHVAIPKPNKEIRERIQAARAKLSGRKLDLNVLIYLLDSVSRVNFIRHCPKFNTLLTKKMGAYVMEGFNIVGDGTPWAVIPMTTGHFQTELPEGRKRFDNASYLDDWPLIFKNYKAAGYVTSFGEEQPNVGTFNYRLKGFNMTPVDHYLRTFMLANNDHTSKYPHCVGDTPLSIIQSNFWREMQITNRRMGGRHFSVLFSSELSHDDYNTVQMLDEHWVDQFDQLHQEGFFNDTLLIVMADHGHRYGSVRQTQSGKMEEKLPFLAFILPPWFKNRFPKVHANLIQNQHRLVTAFDLHATFLDLLDFHEDGGLGDIHNRGISLFREIPAERTCAHAHIKPHFCSCLDWSNVEDADKDPLVLKAAQQVIDYFNHEIQEVRGRCANLSLGSLVWAHLLKPNDQLMAFKESIDDDMFEQDLSDASKFESIMYQLRFITKPGDADFEASVSYFSEKKEFLMSSDDISRLNAYHDQALCVISTHGHLRTFCYCV